CQASARIKTRVWAGLGPPAALATVSLPNTKVETPLSSGRAGTAVAAASIVPIAGPGSYLPLTGGTMTGDLILNRDPVSANMAATGHYVSAGGGQHLASVLQEGRENGKIGARFGFMLRMSAGE